MSKPTFTPTNDMISAANAVAMAMAYVQTIRPIVLANQQKVLDRHSYKCGNELAIKCIERGIDIPEFCKTAHDLIYISEADFAHYHTECRQLHNQNGLTVEDPEQCPLLVAESMERKAKDTLAEVMQPITNLTKDMIFQSSNAMENWNKYIDLNMKLLAPYLNNPFKK